MSLPSATNDSSSRDARRPSVPTADSSLPKERRLRKRAEFQQVYQEGVRIPGRYFALFFRRTDTDALGRFGLTVSRKVGKAAVRTRVKRLLRESMRQSWDWLPEGGEAVFHAWPAISEADFGAVQSEVRRALDKAARRSGK